MDWPTERQPQAPAQAQAQAQALERRPPPPAAAALPVAHTIHTDNSAANDAHREETPAASPHVHCQASRGRRLAAPHTPAEAEAEAGVEAGAEAETTGHVHMALAHSSEQQPCDDSATAGSMVAAAAASASRSEVQRPLSPLSHVQLPLHRDPPPEAEAGAKPLEHGLQPLHRANIHERNPVSTEGTGTETAASAAMVSADPSVNGHAETLGDRVQPPHSHRSRSGPHRPVPPPPPPPMRMHIDVPMTPAIAHADDDRVDTRALVLSMDSSLTPTERALAAVELTPKRLFTSADETVPSPLAASRSTDTGRVAIDTALLPPGPGPGHTPAPPLRSAMAAASPMHGGGDSTPGPRISRSVLSSPQTSMSSFPLGQFLLEGLQNLPFVSTWRAEAQRAQTKEEEVKQLRALAKSLTEEIAKREGVMAGQQQRTPAVGESPQPPQPPPPAPAPESPRLIELQSELADIRLQLQQESFAHSTLQSRVSELEQALEESHASHDELRRSLAEEHSMEIAQLQEERARLQSDHAECEVQLIARMEREKELQEELNATVAAAAAAAADAATELEEQLEVQRGQLRSEHEDAIHRETQNREAETQAAQATITALETSLADLQAQLDSDRRTWEERLEEQNRRIESMRMELSAARTSVQELTAAMESERARADAAEEALAAARQQLQRVEAQRSSLLEQLDQSNRAAEAAARDHAEQLRQAAALLQSSESTAVSRLAEQCERHEELEGQLRAELHSCKRDMDAAALQATEETNALRQQLQSAQAMLQATEEERGQELVRVQAQLLESQQALSSLQHSSQTAASESASLQVRLSAESASLRSEMQRVRDETVMQVRELEEQHTATLRTVSQALEEARAQVVELTDVRDELHTQIAQLQSQASAVEQERAAEAQTAQSALASLQASLADVRAQSETARRTLEERAEEQNHRHQTELSAAQAAAQELRAFVEHERARADKAAEALASAQQQLQHVETQRSSLLEQLEQANHATEVTSNAHADQLRQTTALLQSSETARVALSAQLEQVQSDLADRAERMASLELQLTDAREQLAQSATTHVAALADLEERSDETARVAASSHEAQRSSLQSDLATAAQRLEQSQRDLLSSREECDHLRVAMGRNADASCVESEELLRKQLDEARAQLDQQSSAHAKALVLVREEVAKSVAEAVDRCERRHEAEVARLGTQRQEEQKRHEEAFANGTAQVNTLRAELAAAVQTYAADTHQAQTAHEMTLAELETAHAAAKQEWQGRMAVLGRNHASLQTQLDAARADAAAAASASSTAAALQARTDAERSRMQKAVMQSQEETAALRESVASMRREVESLRSELKEEHALREQLAAALKQTEAREAQASISTRDALASARQEAAAARASLVHEHEVAQAASRDLLAAARADATASAQELSKVREQLALARREQHVAESDALVQRESATSLRAALDSAQAEIAALQHRMSALDAADTERQVESLAREQELEVEASVARDAARAAEARAREASARAEEMRQAASAATATAATAQESARESAYELKVLQLSHSALQDELARVRAEVTRLQSELATSSSDKQQLWQQMKHQFQSSQLSFASHLSAMHSPAPAIASATWATPHRAAPGHMHLALQSPADSPPAAADSLAGSHASQELPPQSQGDAVLRAQELRLAMDAAATPDIGVLVQQAQHRSIESDLSLRVENAERSLRSATAAAEHQAQSLSLAQEQVGALQHETEELARQLATCRSAAFAERTSHALALESLQTECARLRSERADLVDQLASARSHARSCESQLHDATARAMEAQRSLDLAQQALLDRQKRIDALIARVDAADAAAAEAAAAAARRVDPSVVDALKSALEEAQASATRRVDSSVAVVEGLRARLASAEALAASRADPSDMEVLQALLEEARADSARKVDPAVLSTVRAELSAASSRVASLEHELERSEASVRTSAARISLLESDARGDALSHEQALASSAATVAELQHSLARAEATARSASARMSTLESELRAANAAVEEQRAAALASTISADRLRHSLEHGEAAQRAQSERVAALTLQLRETQESAAKMVDAAELARVQTRLDAAQAAVSKSTAAYEDLHASSGATIAELQRSVARLEAGARSSDARVSSLEAELRESATTNDQLHASMHTAAKTTATLRRELERAEAARQEAEQRAEAAEEQLQKALADARGRVDAATLHRMQEQLDAAKAAEHEMMSTAADRLAALESQLRLSTATITQLRDALDDAEAAQSASDERISVLESELHASVEHAAKLVDPAHLHAIQARLEDVVAEAQAQVEAAAKADPDALAAAQARVEAQASEIEHLRRSLAAAESIAQRVAESQSQLDASNAALHELHQSAHASEAAAVEARHRLHAMDSLTNLTLDELESKVARSAAMTEEAQLALQHSAAQLHQAWVKNATLQSELRQALEAHEAFVQGPHAQLQAECARHADQCRLLTEQVSQLRAELATAQAQLKELQSDPAQTQRVHLLQAEVQRLRAELVAAHGCSSKEAETHASYRESAALEIRQALARIDELQTHAARLELQRSSLDAQLGVHVEETAEQLAQQRLRLEEEHAARLASVERSRAPMQQELSATNSALRECRARIEALEAELRAREAEATAAAQEGSSLQSDLRTQLQAAQATLSAVQRSARAAKIALQKRTEALKHAEAERDVALAQVQEHVAAALAQQQALSDCQREAVAAGARHAQATRETESRHARECADLRQSLQDAPARHIEELRATELAASHADHAAMQARLDQAAADRSTDRASLHELQERCGVLQGQMDAEVARRRIAEDEALSLRSELALRSEALSAAQALRDQSTHDSHAELESLRASSAAASFECNKLQASVLALQQELDDARAAGDLHASRIRQVGDVRVQALQREIQALRTRLEEAATQRHKHRQELDASFTEIDKLRARMDSEGLEWRAATRDTLRELSEARAHSNALESRLAQAAEAPSSGSVPPTTFLALLTEHQRLRNDYTHLFEELSEAQRSANTSTMLTSHVDPKVTSSPWGASPVPMAPQGASHAFFTPPKIPPPHSSAAATPSAPLDASAASLAPSLRRLLAQTRSARAHHALDRQRVGELMASTFAAMHGDVRGAMGVLVKRMGMARHKQQQQQQGPKTPVVPDHLASTR